MTKVNIKKTTVQQLITTLLFIHSFFRGQFCVSFGSNVSFHLMIPKCRRIYLNVSRDYTQHRSKSWLSFNKIICYKNEHNPSKTLNLYGVYVLLSFINFLFKTFLLSLHRTFFIIRWVKWWCHSVWSIIHIRLPVTWCTLVVNWILESHSCKT